MNAESLKKYIFKNERIEFILQALDCHNIQYHSNNNYFSAAFPDGDNLKGIIINNTEYLHFHSFSRDIQNANEHKDLITLVEYIKKISFIDSIKYLHSLLGIEFKSKDFIIKPKQNVNPLWIFERLIGNTQYFNCNDIQYLDETLLNDYIPILYIDWFREGVMSWSAKKFNIAYSYKNKRIIIPHRSWNNGRLVGVNARTTIINADELGIKKYWLTPSYKKSLNVYGLWENKTEIEQHKRVIIFESEKSVLKRDSLCDSDCVAISGKNISSEQVAIILSLKVNEIIIALDKDVQIEEIRYICAKFYQHRKVSYIYDKWNILSKKDSPADTTNKNYQFLFDNRITFDNKEYQEYKKGLNKNR